MMMRAVVLVLVPILVFLGLSSVLVSRGDGWAVLSPFSRYQSSLLAPRVEVANATGVTQVCLTVRTYGKQLPYLPTLLFSAASHGFHSLRIFIVNTDRKTDEEALRTIVGSVNTALGNDRFVVYLPYPVTNQSDPWGYTQTDAATDYLFDSANGIKCEYMLYTNGDNVYFRHFGHHLKTSLKLKKDIIAWHWITHYGIGNRDSEGVRDDGTCRCAKPSFNHDRSDAGHDLGAVIYRSEFLEQNNLRFRLDNGKYEPWVDTALIKAQIQKTDNFILHKQVLFAHQ